VARAEPITVAMKSYASYKKEIKHVSGAIKKLSLERIVPRSRNQIVSHSFREGSRSAQFPDSCATCWTCYIFVYLGPAVWFKFRGFARQPWMLALSKIVRILRFCPNVFQQLG